MEQESFPQQTTAPLRLPPLQPNLALREHLKKLHRLPEPIRLRFFSEETWATLEHIAAAYKLDTQHYAVLAEITGKVLTGDFHPNLLVSNISAQFGLTREEARKIAIEVSGQIFAPVRSELASLYGLEQPQQALERQTQ